MACEELDLKGYLFGELDQAGQARVTGHLPGCLACREEMERLQRTQMALGILRDEEPPRRIAFVSDKVFEPRWWQRISWQNWTGPTIGFASAAMLALAILAHGEITRPAAPANALKASVDTATLEQKLRQDFNEQMQSAVAKAVADVRAQNKKDTVELLNAVQKHFSDQRRADLVAFDATIDNLYKRSVLDRQRLAYASQSDSSQTNGGERQ